MWCGDDRMTKNANRRAVLKGIGSTGIAAVSGVALTGTAAAAVPCYDVDIDDIPDHFLSTYKGAAREYGIDWEFLAAIGRIETNHGQCCSGCATSSAGARGPMQFMPSTWDSYGYDANGNGDADPCEYVDAIYSAANYLTAIGAPEDYHGAAGNYYGCCCDNYCDAAICIMNKYMEQSDGGGGSYDWPYFSRGDESTDIYTVQYLLEEHGYALEYHDGIFGPETESHVEQFQADYGLTVDGIVGPNTWSELIVDVYGPDQDPWWATYAVQHNLRYDHGYSIAVDGYYGSETEAAIESFQSASNIAVDGLVGPETWRALVAQ